jgi:lysophospholipase L1-like esterase
MVSSLPAEFLDPHTPPEVVVTDQIRPRITDSTLGVPLGVPGPDLPSVPDPPRHALVTVGDSLTHGMSSGAVFHTDLSWPALVARSLGVGLVVPAYGGPLDGLPLNIEALLRGVQGRFGDELNVLEMVQLPFELHSLADANEDYWERGDGSRPPRTDLRYENVGVYGWDVRDCLSSTAARAMARIASHPPHDDLLGAKPDNDNDIAAASVLAPFGSAAAQIDAVASHGHDGGIGTLVVMLGANNALGSVVRKSVVWSGPGFQDLDRKGAYTAWNPVHFQAEYAELVRQLLPVPARRVLLATVPHVTVAPIATGVNPANPGEKWREGSRYFPYYTDPWIAEQDFRPDKNRNITHQQARAIDSAIDQYNDAIQEHVRRARADGRDWHLVDLCGILDGVAYRRYIDDPVASAAQQDWQPYPLPAPIAGLDTRFYRSDETGRLQGGLFGLDAVHPTTAGYGVIAQAVLDVLNSAGVASPGIDFTQLLAQDTLNSDPPALFTRIFTLLAPFLTRLASAPASTGVA